MIKCDCGEEYNEDNIPDIYDQVRSALDYMEGKDEICVYCDCEKTITIPFKITFLWDKAVIEEE